MENYMINFTLNIYHAGSDAIGITTSGGTDSIANAVLSYKMKYLAWGITKPNIVASIYSHPALNRACWYYNIELRLIPYNNSLLDLGATQNEIDQNTIALYASYNEYCIGHIEPIWEMGRLAIRNDIGLHVDCCLGGYFFPFAKREFEDLQYLEFDFTVPGVQTISVDTHKYGCGPKGLSILLFWDKELKNFLNMHSKWEGGF